MKKMVTLLLALVVVLICVLPVLAAEGKVTYSGNAGSFVFEPGSAHSPTDLFPEFKDVMPGDTLTQKITLRNEADKEVKVKVYLRSLGAHEDSMEFLSRLGLQVRVTEDNEMACMFDAAAHETAQLTDWVYLGTLYSGGEVNLEVILTVPVELDNAFQNQVGCLDWEFMVEELPVENTDPKPPVTGDSTNPGLWLAVMVGSLVMLFVLLLLIKRNKDREESAGKC